MSALCQALRWPLTREQHLFQRALKHPRTKRGQGETRSAQNSAAMRSPYWISRAERAKAPLDCAEEHGTGVLRPIHPQESGNLPRFWESLLLFCFALSRTKKAKKRNKREIARRVGMNHSSQRWQNPPHLTLRRRSSISFQSGLQSSD